jgi:hypothetical protein
MVHPTALRTAAGPPEEGIPMSAINCETCEKFEKADDEYAKKKDPSQIEAWAQLQINWDRHMQEAHGGNS